MSDPTYPVYREGCESEVWTDKFVVPRDGQPHHQSLVDRANRRIVFRILMGSRKGDFDRTCNEWVQYIGILEQSAPEQTPRIMIKYRRAVEVTKVKVLTSQTFHHTG